MARNLPPIISQEEFEKMFSYALELEKKAKKRKKKIRSYRLAMLLGFESGLRISEIVGYKGLSKKKNKTTGEIVVKEVEIKPLSEEMVETACIRLKNAKGGKDRVTARPKRLNANALNMLPLKIKRRALQAFIKKVGKEALGKDIHFHTLRHGFATHYYNKTKDILGLQQLMGHSRTDTTSIYSHINPEETIKQVRDVF
jgi:site-specific recombinase XerD